MGATASNCRQRASLSWRQRLAIAAIKHVVKNLRQVRHSRAKDGDLHPANLPIPQNEPSQRLPGFVAKAVSWSAFQWWPLVEPLPL